MTTTSTSSVGTLTLNVPYTQIQINPVSWANAHTPSVIITTTVSTLDYKGYNNGKE